MTLKHDILAALSYFDLFNYPLTQTEIFQFVQNSYAHHEFSNALQQLVFEGWVYSFDDFYTLQDNYELIPRRILGNAKARTMLKTAEKWAGFLSLFPFVRGVAVSGSLSKNFADESSDIDFFIITAPNRLWIARTFMHCFKKLTFLVKKENWFCMNYYIDQESLKIREQNIYTAIEVATLLPLRGITAFSEFYLENKWSRNFLPNHTMRVSYVKETGNPIVKRIMERIFSNHIGSYFDILLMKLTARKWRKKTRESVLNHRGIVMSMDCSRHYSKPDPKNFQVKLVDAYEKKISHLFRRYGSKAKTIY